MHNVIPLAQIDRDTIRDLAYAAADRGENRDEANPFAPGTTKHQNFEHDFIARELAMVDLVTS